MTWWSLYFSDEDGKKTYIQAIMFRISLLKLAFETFQKIEMGMKVSDKIWYNILEVLERDKGLRILLSKAGWLQTCFLEGNTQKDREK